jgi:RNA polymerase-interacting CarD/CdnL/TRCF family regulator
MTMKNNALSFRIGEKVVYPTHGVDEIPAIQQQDDEAAA